MNKTEHAIVPVWILHVLIQAGNDNEFPEDLTSYLYSEILYWGIQIASLAYNIWRERTRGKTFVRGGRSVLSIDLENNARRESCVSFKWVS